MDQPYAAFQNDIYLKGVGGERPRFPIAMQKLAREAYSSMSPEARGYVEGGAGSGYSMRANREAFQSWRIVPRMLKGVAERDLSVDLLGMRLPAPVLLAPIGVQSIVHDDAEVAVARAAADVGVPMVLSTAASRSMEDVADAGGDNLRWFQLYWPNDRDLTVSFLDRARDAGYSAIVVTLDTPMLAWRPRDLEAGFLPFLVGQGTANYFSDPVFRAALDKSPEEDLMSAVLRWVQVFADPGKTWDDLAFIRDHTELPILLKGVLHPADAALAVEHGMAGVIVSNHGGRQVDGSIATLDALPAVVGAVPGDFPVLFDSGIRGGADALKALALGARAVLLGRPYIWGLALGGDEGVAHVLKCFLAELDLTLALSGHTTPATLDASVLERAHPASRP